MLTKYGPQLSEKYNYSDSLVKFMQQCTKYVADLQQFDRFCVWRYTIGSASVNYVLIFNKLGDNAPPLTYLFFLYYLNTYGVFGISSEFSKWTKYFAEPDEYNKLPAEFQRSIASELLSMYTKKLQSIIMKAQATPGEFHVFKVSSSYPGLPKNNNEVPASVMQLPFNSTTINPYFNFAPFLAPDAACCLFDIVIPKGSKCLFIPQEYHAYSFELEVLLPFNCIFNIKKIRTAILEYIDPKSVNTITVQQSSMIRVGPVYEINEFNPCGQSYCVIREKEFTVYDTIYSTS